VSRALPEAIVDFLAFSGTTSDHRNELRGFSHREWGHALIWLDDAGLALYFLQKLEDTNATEMVPMEVLSRLEHSLAANQQRVAHMAHQFSFLNQQFDEAGVRYLVVKGLSLVPQFCPDACLRHQSDFDYLVSHESLPVAQRVLRDVGYSLRRSSANEFAYLMPSAGILPAVDNQYEAHAPHAVELRLAFWDSDSHGVPLAEPKFSVDNVRTHRWQDLTFPTLPVEDAFLLQVIHAFNHILTSWVRMSWLYEIGYFLNQRATDVSLWEGIERRIGDDPLLREIVIVITQLSAQLFRTSVPSTSKIWGADLRPTVRIWIQNYARTWMFAKNQPDQFSFFSASKAILFLHQQYIPDTSARRHRIWIRLFPWERFSEKMTSITAKSSRSPGGRRQQIRRIPIRFLFHVTTGLRYLWEVPRWRRLNKETTYLARSSRR
jgi:hypothetical protein